MAKRKPTPIHRIDGMTPKQRMFALEYLKDFNGTQAAIRAGYSQATAHAQGCRLLRHADVAKFLADKADKAEFTAQDVNRVVGSMLRYDVRRMFNADGSPKDITELDEETAMAIGGFEMVEQFEGSGKERKFVGYLKKFKMVDRNAAAGHAIKLRGLGVEKHEHTGANGQPLIPAEDPATLAKKVAFILMRGATNPKEAAVSKLDYPRRSRLYAPASEPQGRGQVEQVTETAAQGHSVTEPVTELATAEVTETLEKSGAAKQKAYRARNADKVKEADRQRKRAKARASQLKN